MVLEVGMSWTSRNLKILRETSIQSRKRQRGPIHFVNINQLIGDDDDDDVSRTLVI